MIKLTNILKEIQIKTPLTIKYLPEESLFDFLKRTGKETFGTIEGGIMYLDKIKNGYSLKISTTYYPPEEGKDKDNYYFYRNPEYFGKLNDLTYKRIEFFKNRFSKSIKIKLIKDPSSKDKYSVRLLINKHPKDFIMSKEH